MTVPGGPRPSGAGLKLAMAGVISAGVAFGGVGAALVFRGGLPGGDPSPRPVAAVGSSTGAPTPTAVPSASASPSSPSSTSLSPNPRRTPTTAPALPSKPCVLAYQANVNCVSTDPTVRYYVVYLGDTRRCTFRVLLDWGDGGSIQSITTRGGTKGRSHLADHTYRAPGRYAISVTMQKLAGPCNGIDEVYRFTLLPTPPGGVAA